MTTQKALPVLFLILLWLAACTTIPQPTQFVAVVETETAVALPSREPSPTPLPPVATRQSSPMPATATLVPSATTGWAILKPTADSAANRILRTGDGGQTWTLIQQIDWRADQLDFVNDREGWAVARAGEAMALVHTNDGGVT